ncbi:MAG: hypothetical protein HN337_08105 [Deltaproteobacteria bacterium]|jgi:hypothetical protein|nr:hypothetical protein [Deltaproteobacteria bacterium]
MSDVRGKKNPFAGPLGSKPHRVPNTYGARRDLNRVKSTGTAPSKHAPVDKFDKKQNKPKNLESYKSGRDKFKKTRRIATDTPYRPARLEGIENGTTPVVTTPPTEITDEMRINFLDNIIKNADKIGSGSRARQSASRQPSRKPGAAQLNRPGVDPRSRRSHGVPVKGSE